MPVTKGAGNPDWTWDETLLTLDLLYRHGAPLDKRHSDVIALSERLRSAAIHPEEARKESFRNPDGVALKMQNLQSAIDPSRRLSSSRTDRAVASAYPPTEKEVVAKVAAQILGELAQFQQIEDVPDDLTFGYAKPGSAYHKKGYIPNIVAAVIEVRRSIALPRAIANTQKLLAANDLDATRIGAALCLQISEIGESVDDATKVTLRSWLAKNEEQNIAGILPKCLKLAWLREDALQRIAGLKREELSRASGQLASELLDRAAELYATSPNWDSASSFAAKVAIPNASSFTIDHLEKIFWSADAGHGDLKGSHGFHDFVEALYKEHPAGATKITEMLVKHSMADYAV